MKTIKLIRIIALFLFTSAVSFSQSYINTVWKHQAANPSGYDMVATALCSASGNLITTANNYLGSASQIYLNCVSNGTTTWQQNCTGSSSSNSSYGVDVKIDASGNVYTCGAFHTGSNYNYRVAKYSSTGVMAWQSYYNGPGNIDDIPCALAIDNSGNVYVTGTSYGVTSMTDYATIKYDNAGNQIWVSRYNNVNLPEVATDLVLDNSGNIYVTGSSATSMSNADITTIKYNSSGAQQALYRFNYLGNGMDLASEMVLDNSNNVILTGSLDNGTKKFGTLKLSNSLSLLWSNINSGTGVSEGSGLITDNGNSIISVGYQNNSFGGSDILINKYSSSGSVTWTRKISSPVASNFSKGRKVKTDINNNIYIAADAVFNGNRDFYTLCLNLNGDTKWAQIYNSTTNGIDIPNAIQINNGEVFVTGISTNGSTKQVTSVKYAVNDKPFAVGGTPSTGEYVKNELVVWFDPSVVNKLTVDRKDFTSGRLADFVSSSVLTLLSNKTGIKWDDFQTFKVHTRLRTYDSISITRLGNPIKIPPFWSKFEILIPADFNEQTLADSIMKIYPEIKRASLNTLYTRNNIPNDPLILNNNQAALVPTPSYANAHVNVDGAWDLETGKSTVKVGVFDDLILYTHEDFGGGSLSSSKIADGYDYKNNVNITSQVPNNSHGTACAGIIGALRNNGKGVAGIAGGDVVGSSNTGSSLYTMVIVDGTAFATNTNIEAAIVEGATSPMPGYGFGLDVQSHSWGSGAYNQDIYDAVEYCWRNGCTFVASRGNNGTTNPNYPACYRDAWVINVGASGIDGKHKVATNGDLSFPYTWESDYGQNVDVIAPGVTELVTTTYDPANPFDPWFPTPASNYSGFDGTSASAPHVAGIAALMHSKHDKPAYYADNLAPEDVEHIMEKYAIDIVDGNYPAGYDQWNGFGRVDAKKCVEMVNAPQYFVRHSSSYDASWSSVVTASNIVITAPNGFPGVAAAGNYICDRYKINRNFYCTKNPWEVMIDWWPLFAFSGGTDLSNPITGATGIYSFSSPPSVFSPFAVMANLEYYTYYIKTDMAANTIGKWWPSEPSSIVSKYTVHFYDPTAIGINESIEESSNVVVYPNPSNDVVNITIKNNSITKDDKFELYDVSGKLIEADRITEYTTKLNIAELSDGIYILKIRQNDNAIVKKIVKE